jgi:hypothetical protein
VLFVFGGCDGHGDAVGELMMLHTGLPQAGWRRVPTFGDVLEDGDDCGGFHHTADAEDLPFEAAAPVPQARSHHGMALSRPGGASDHPLLFICGGTAAGGRVLHDLWYLPLRFDGLLPPRWQQVVVPAAAGAIPRGVGHQRPPMVDAALRAGSCPPAHAADKSRPLGRTHGTLTALPYQVAGVPAEPGHVPIIWAGGCAPADRPPSELPPAALLTVRIAKEDRKPLPTAATRHASSGFTPSRRGISFFNQNGAAMAVEDTQPAAAELVECCALRVSSAPRFAGGGGGGGGDSGLPAPKPPKFHGWSTAPAACPVILSEAFGLRAATLLWCGPDACRTAGSVVADTADADGAAAANGGMSPDSGPVEDAALFGRRLGLSIHGVSLISA